MTDPSQPPEVDFSAYRACPICKVALGDPCVSLSGRVVAGRPDGVLTRLPRAHAARKMRTRQR